MCNGWLTRLSSLQWQLGARWFCQFLAEIWFCLEKGLISEIYLQCPFQLVIIMPISRVVLYFRFSTNTTLFNSVVNRIYFGCLNFVGDRVAYFSWALFKRAMKACWAGIAAWLSSDRQIILHQNSDGSTLALLALVCVWVSLNCFGLQATAAGRLYLQD